MKCCICGASITPEEGHDPFPIRPETWYEDGNEEGRCCELCDHHYVIRARMKLGRTPVVEAFFKDKDYTEIEELFDKDSEDKKYLGRVFNDFKNKFFKPGTYPLTAIIPVGGENDYSTISISFPLALTNIQANFFYTFTDDHSMWEVDLDTCRQILRKASKQVAKVFAQQYVLSDEANSDEKWKEYLANWGMNEQEVERYINGDMKKKVNMLSDIFYKEQKFRITLDSYERITNK